MSLSLGPGVAVHTSVDNFSAKAVIARGGAVVALLRLQDQRAYMLDYFGVIGSVISLIVEQFWRLCFGMFWHLQLHQKFIRWESITVVRFRDIRCANLARLRDLCDYDQLVTIPRSTSKYLQANLVGRRQSASTPTCERAFFTNRPKSVDGSLSL